ncbi:MAG: NAD(P)H-dependent oxidoreductase subunit E [Pirellulales bacterium]|nr:NAD(P)H-dependent oxidoreductase subunit E [Pirellulales bacterium]
MSTTTRVLTPEMIAAIQAFIPRYPNKQAVTLPALHIVNEALRYVPLEAVIEIAELLELAPAQVQDTLSFYGYFKQDQPHGKTRAWVCRSISCALRGGEEVLERLCQRAGVKPGETTPDGRLTVEFAECLGACEYAPCMLATHHGGQAELHKNLTPEQMESFVNRLPQ